MARQASRDRAFTTIFTLPPLHCSSSLLLLHVVFAQVVGDAVHTVAGGEDVIEVREDVVGGESDELAPTPKHLAEEVVRIESVGVCMVYIIN